MVSFRNLSEEISSEPERHSKNEQNPIVNHR